MKKISLYFLLGFISFSFSLKAQWTEINTEISSPKDICFLDSLTGFITTGSSIYKTINGGYNWELLASGVSNAYYIAAYNQDTIIVGKNELKVSYDGGQTWNNISGYTGNIVDMAIIGDYIYCMHPDVTSCTWNEQTTSFNVHDLVRSKDFGNNWELVSDLIRPPVKLSSISNEVGAAFGGYVLWDDVHCYYSLGTIAHSINGNNYEFGASGELVFMAGSILPNLTKHLVWSFFGWDLPKLSVNGHTTQGNEIYLDVTDLVFFDYANGYLIKGSDIYRTNDIGDTWDFDINTGSTVLKSLYLENGNIILICADGSLFISKYYLNVQEYDLTPNTNVIEFPDILVGNSDSRTLYIYNTGSKAITISANVNEPFFINPIGTTDTLNQLTDVVIGEQEALEINIIFKPEEAMEYNENMQLSINEDPDLEYAVSLSGEGILFDGTFYADTLLCADTIVVDKRWIIPKGIRVEVCPGTLIKIDEFNFPRIDVYGSLLAFGEKDNIILFETANSSAYINISSSINDSALFKNCKFKESIKLILDDAHNVLIDSSEFEEHIEVYSSVKTHISNSIFKNDYYIWANRNQYLTISSSKFYGGSGVYIHNSDSVIISKNEIYNSSHGALMFKNSSGLIEGNYIYNNSNYSTYGIGGGGLNVRNSNAIILNNFIFNNTSNNEAGGVYINEYDESSNIELINNTICSNENSGVYWQYARGKMHNNIVYNNPVEIMGEEITISYNFLPEDFTGDGNVTGNPHFRNPSREVGILNYAEELDWRILSDSPCLDAGNNEVVGDLIFDFYGNPRIIDGNRDGSAIVDMGAYEMDSELFGIEETEKKFAQVFPNPSKGKIQIHLDKGISLPLELEIFDVSGVLVLKSKLNDHEIKLDIDELKRGAYLLRLIGEKVSQREIFILQ